MHMNPDELKRLSHLAGVASLPGLDAVPPLLSSGRHQEEVEFLEKQLSSLMAKVSLPAPEILVYQPAAGNETAQQVAQQASPLARTQGRVIGSWSGPLQFGVVAVGGTFDRLHSGHRLLLAATALVATERIFVGITADKLLSNKKNRHMLQPYEAREACAVGYMQRVNPAVEVTSGPLSDPMVPPIAATEAGFHAIVVSEETIHGAEEINRVRASLGFEPLVIVVVGLLSGTPQGPKLSSTDLRAIAASSSSQ